MREFTAVQLHTKFKKAIAECKKAALPVKTVTGIKSFQDEKGYGPWFHQLYSLVKTWDSCQPWQVIEPSAEADSRGYMSENCSTSPLLSHSHTISAELEAGKSLFVPVKNA